MKKILFALMIILCTSGVALASPFLVCDPQSSVEYYVVTGLPASMDASHILPDSTGTYGFKYDLALLPVGNYTVRAKACHSLWGCSVDSNPFQFVRPVSSTGPVNLKLVQ